MPEFLTNPDQIRIHELTVEEPKKPELRFDVEKEFSEEDIQVQKRWLEIQFGDHDNKEKFRDQYARDAAAMVVLFPDRKSEIYSEEMWPLLQKNLESSYTLQSKNRQSPDIFEEFLTNLAILDPKRTRVWLAAERERDDIFHQMQDRLDEKKDRNKWDEYAAIATEMFIIFPDKIKEIGVDKDAKKALIDDATRLHELYDPDGEDFFWVLCGFVAELRILCQLTKQELPISQEEYEDILRFFHKIKGIPAEGVPRLAKHLKILSAESVSITENGFEIMSAKPSIARDETPSLPESRNF
jgi:hypothetical protein